MYSLRCADMWRVPAAYNTTGRTLDQKDPGQRLPWLGGLQQSCYLYATSFTVDTTPASQYVVSKRGDAE